LSNFVPCVPDGSTGLLEVVHCVECGAEYGEPEKEAWKGNCEEEEGPGEADQKTGDYCATREGLPNTVVFDSPAG
jgi:hypothetical protein